MKKILSVISFTLISIIMFAQNTRETYIIKFKDKGQSPSYSISNPTTFLSDRAIERRLLQQIPLDETDLPVNPDYINEIKNNGAAIFYTSKWLNIAIAYVDDDQHINKIKGLSFVKDVRQSKVIEESKEKQSFKQFFTREKYQKIDLDKYANYKSLGFNYGPSANQAQMLKIDQLHNQGYTGNGITIAVIDAGFNSVNTMVVFDSLRAGNKILGTRDFVQPGNNVYNNNLSTHGTMVLSTMGANLPGQIVGTAPHASYYLFRTEDATAEYLMEEFYWVQAAEYADSLGIDVLNTSLGYTRFDNPLEDHTYEDMDGNTTPITIGADMAAKKGMLVINSAGNEGGNPWRYISAPADGDSVLTVGAVNYMGQYAYFSSTGPTADGRIKPDVVAQGYEAIVAIVPSGIAAASGTSFSSPIMSGAAACLWQANPTYTNMEIYNAIKQSGNKSSNPDNLTGWGIPDFVVANSLLVGNISEALADNTIKSYPNPFSDFIISEFYTHATAQTEVRLINSMGMVIKTNKPATLTQGINRIKFEDLGLLPNGIYFIQISDGTRSFTRKVVK